MRHQRRRASGGEGNVYGDGRKGHLALTISNPQAVCQWEHYGCCTPAQAKTFLQQLLATDDPYVERVIHDAVLRIARAGR